MVLKEYKTNGVTIRFHDEYCRDADEERVQLILKRIAARAMLDLNAAASAEALRTD